MASFFRSLCMVISSAFFTLIPKLYGLFYDLAAQPTLFLPETLQRLSNNIYVLISVVMLFALATKLIATIVNPELLLDSKKGVTGVVKRALIALVLIIIIPFGFDYFYKFQTEVISKQLIEKVILGMALDEGENVNSKYNVGQVLAATALQSVLYPADGDECTPGVGVGTKGVLSKLLILPVKPSNGLIDTSSYDLCSLYNSAINDDVSYTMLMVNSINATTGLHINSIVESERNSEGNYYVLTFEYWGILAVIVSGVIVYLLVIFCIDSAVRLIKMGFLELTAPISVIAYIYGGENVLKNWAKELFNTAISFFIRVAAIAFMALVLTRIPDFVNNFDENYKKLASLFIIIGTLIFVKKAPELVEKILGIKINLQGGIGGRLGQMAGVGKAAQNAWRSLGTNAGNAAKLGLAAAGAGIGFGALQAGKGLDNLVTGGKAQNAINGIRNSSAFKGLGAVASAAKTGISSGGGIKGMKAAVDSYKKNPNTIYNRAIRANNDNVNFANSLGVDYATGRLLGSRDDLERGQRASGNWVRSLRSNNNIERNTRDALENKNEANQAKTNVEKFQSHYNTVSDTLQSAAENTKNDAYSNKLQNLRSKWLTGNLTMDDLVSKVKAMADVELSSASVNTIIGKANSLSNMAEKDASLAALITDSGISNTSLVQEVSSRTEASNNADAYFKNLYDNSSEREKKELDKYTVTSDIINKEIAVELGRGQDKYEKVSIGSNESNASQNTESVQQRVDRVANVSEPPTHEEHNARYDDLVSVFQPDFSGSNSNPAPSAGANNANMNTNQNEGNNQSNNAPDMSSYFDGLSQNIRDSAASTNEILSEQIKNQQTLINEAKNQGKSLENMSNNMSELSGSMNKMSDNLNRYTNTSIKNAKDIGKKLDQLNNNNNDNE